MKLSKLMWWDVKKAPWWGDYVRSTDDYTDFILSHFIRDFLFQPRLKYMVYFRYSQVTNNRFIHLFCKYRIFQLCHKYGIEIKTQTQIGEGFLMIHPYNITISTNAKLGKNINILKGATIGKSEGKNPGAPVMGDSVYIGLNSTVIGGITIGDDVLIAPNTLVNIDVPSHSVVIGNPCKIIPRENDTEKYIIYKINQDAIETVDLDGVKIWPEK